MPSNDTFILILKQLGSAIEPLGRRLATHEATYTFKSLGLDIPQVITSHETVKNALTSVGTIATELPALIKEVEAAIASEDSTSVYAPAAQLAAKSTALLVQIEELTTAITNQAHEGDGVAAADIIAFAQKLPKALLDLCVIRLLENNAPEAESFLELIGIIEHRLDPGIPGDPRKPPFEVRSLRLERFAQLAQKPTEYLDNLFHWGKTSFDGKTLFELVGLVAARAGIPTLYDDGGVGTASLDLFLTKLTVDSSVTPPGILASIRVPLSQTVQTSIPLSSSGWRIDMQATGGADAGAIVHVRPVAEISMEPPSGAFTGEAAFRLVGEPQNGPFQLLGIGGGVQLNAKRIWAEVKASSKWETAINRASLDILVGAAIEEGRFLLDASGADSFVQSLFGNTRAEADFGIIADWSWAHGLRFKGNAGLEITIPIHRSFVVFEFQTLHVGMRLAQDAKIQLEASINFSARLGPVTAVVERIGLRADATFPATRGNLGPLNLDLGFKPPNGIGLVIKAQVVTGGGYLYFDFEKEQYAGVLQLEIAQKFSLTAVGLLTTKMPDGKPGFSLLVIISVRFEPGIQLGYGFSLNGLGGLLGINRIADTKALQERLRRGALGSILFPQNVVENAPQIISNLSAIFPPAQDRFLFGPMAIIGWGGSPPLLSMEIGIILEFSESFRLMILGRLRVTLPGKSDESGQAGGSGTGAEEKEEDTPKIKLQLDSLGIFDFGSGEISLNAHLYDSTIGPFTITGDMELRASFGAKPMFLLSVGGFHPAFQAPAGFPSLERVAIGLHKKESGVEVRLQLSAYFALTSNTVQFGSHLDLYVHIAGFVEIIGLLGFDALIQFQPFGVIASFEAMVSVKAMGQTLMNVGLQVNLTGPSPWHVWGKAHFEILLMKETAEFSVVIGRPEPPHLPPPINVEEELLKELRKLSNWSSQLPVGEHPLVTFRDSIPPKDPASKPPPKKVLIHPLAELHINQRLVPLKADPITKYGITTPTGATTFTLTANVAAGVKAGSLVTKDLSDWFARAQFYVMTDAEKLAAPSFEEKNSGVRVTAPEGYTCGKPVTHVIEAAKLSSDPKDAQSPSKLAPAEYLDRVAHLGAAGQAPIRAAGVAKYGDPSWWDQGLTLKPAGYRVVGEEDDGPAPKARATRPAEAPSPSSLFEEAMEGMAAVAEPVMSYSAAHARATRARQRSPKLRTWVVPDIGRKRGER